MLKRWISRRSDRARVRRLTREVPPRVLAAIGDRLESAARALGRLGVSIEEVNRAHYRMTAPEGGR